MNGTVTPGTLSNALSCLLGLMWYYRGIMPSEHRLRPDQDQGAGRRRPHTHPAGGAGYGPSWLHPHIVTVFDIGQEHDQPCMVTELMGGGDVEGLIEKTVDHRLSLERALARKDILTA